jgi:hypothetical protein
MSTDNKTTTIKTDLFNNFKWKRLPIEHDYITIVFCLDEYKNTDSSNIFMENITNEKIKKAIKYILNVMPYQCIIDVDKYNNFLTFQENKHIVENNITHELDKLNQIDKLKNNESDTQLLKDKINKIQNKKTFLFTYNNQNDQNDQNDIDHTLKIMYNISINSHFKDTHKICIGEVNSIPKSILSVADYIFFENKDVINNYFETFNHNIRIKTSNTELYMLDKCNYEYYQLFNFDKHVNSNYN